ncbi:MAG: lytic transglycosylase domain-containing protein [Dysgonamonadaceae bacterium]|jgi:soluble lytic murein transglycosylase-like protein|nr:lytic transglycosylase domain-containing protein [Dysgonamonadaceae bacterium]
MSKKNHYFIAFWCIAGLIPLAICLSGSTEPENQADNSSITGSSIISVPLPSQVSFCGQTIALKRLDMRERFDREINAMAYLHSTTLLYIKRANRYFPVIEPLLKKHNVPDDFKYLCVIESGLDTRAVSPAQAAGLWQFMEQTAKRYGLEIRDGVDERYHIEKATEAACRYFLDAYQLYGDWATVAAAYNAGIARISSFLRQQQAESAFDLWLTPETSRYIFRILAAKEIISHPKKYGFNLKKEDLYPPVEVDWVEVQSNIPRLAVFAQQHGLNYMQLKEYNVWLRDTALAIPKPEKKVYRIAIPKKEDLYYR